MADAAAVILSAIEKVDTWLLQKADYGDDDRARLRSLRVEKKDLVVGMMEVWENKKEMLYRLLVEVAGVWDVEEEKVDSVRLCSFLGEVEDLWELNCREKLHTLLLKMAADTDMENFLSLAVEMADLWKDSKGKLNKEKLYTWLSKKTDLWEQEKLFDLLERMISLERPKRMVLLGEKHREYVEGVRNDLRFILNKLEDEGHLHYFMSDVVEVAQDVQLLFHLQDSDPFILFLHIFKNTRQIQRLTITFWDSSIEFFYGIKLIHKWLQETKWRVLEFGGDERSQINNVREELVGTSPRYSKSDHHAVGLKEDVELLLRNLKTTMCIYGLPGSGKTTLAREFYNHRQIVDRFECRAWVCLSSWKLSRKELLIKLIRQFIHSKRDDMVIEKMENKALRQILHQHLHDKPYVLVLDDVSKVTDLRYVFRSLPKDKRSRLLFTTRRHLISCKPYGDCEHKMKNLDGDESWQLLLQTALCSDEKFPKQLEKRGREMLMRKCGGLPLAIKEVGRQWAEKRRSCEWEQVVESLMYLELSETLVVLESTYLNMDPEVKPFFLRLAFFKEGTTIRYKTLLQIWTAGGGLLEDQRLFGFSGLSEQFIIEKVDENMTTHLTKTIRINPIFHRLSITKAVDEIGFEILSVKQSSKCWFPNKQVICRLRILT